MRRPHSSILPVLVSNFGYFAKYLLAGYLRTPHIGRTKASDVACPAPSPPSRFTKLFTSHHHHQTRSPDISSDFFSPISHQMSSRLLIQVSLPYLSLRFRFREPPRWDSVMCSADQIRFRYRDLRLLTAFFLRKSDFR